MNNRQMTLAVWREEIQIKINKLRALHRLMESTEFIQCVSLEAAETGKFTNFRIIHAINEGDFDTVKTWVHDKLCSEIGDLSIRKLRSVASKLNITRYTSYNRDELIVAIVNEKERRNAENLKKAVERLSLEQGGPDKVPHGEG
jgi:predicted lipase